MLPAPRLASGLPHGSVGTHQTALFNESIGPHRGDRPVAAGRFDPVAARAPGAPGRGQSAADTSWESCARPPAQALLNSDILAQPPTRGGLRVAAAV